MGFYSRHILPRIIDRGMRNDVMEEQRVHAAPLASGRVLEIGMGSGLNIPHYTAQVEHLFGLEPSEHLRDKAAEIADEAAFPVEFVAAGAESIPLDAASVDSVVSSWTMCSIPDIESALQEIRRVLKPGGKFIFIEHGRAPDPSVAKWQDRLAPVFGILAGCSLNKEMDTLISAAGFSLPQLDKNYLDGPRIISYHYIGQAQPL
ncbi:MAG: class I SAM-dependent methyltransferase [Gammaproteobacteria bacterium]